jgi:hypothetical protein
MDYREEGSLARRNGIAYKKCPYYINSYSADEWRRGWNQTNTELAVQVSGTTHLHGRRDRIRASRRYQEAQS